MEKSLGRTVIFERKFGVNIADFFTTKEIDEFIEKQLGKKLKVERIESSVVSKAGNIFKLRDYDVDKRLDDILTE